MQCKCSLVCGYDSVMQTHMDLYAGGSLLCVVMCSHVTPMTSTAVSSRHTTASPSHQAHQTLQGERVRAHLVKMKDTDMDIDEASDTLHGSLKQVEINLRATHTHTHTYTYTHNQTLEHTDQTHTCTHVYVYK